MKALPKWKKKLTKREREHIIESTIDGTLRSFKEGLGLLKKYNNTCPTCSCIAKKLGLEV